MNIKTFKLAELQFLPFNRIVNHNQVNKLSNSITNHGILRTPVVVNTKAFGKPGIYVLDGQHMIHALTKLGHKTVKAICFESSKLDEIVKVMATLNNVVLKWGMLDYIKAYAEIGLLDYRRLYTDIKAYGYNANICIRVTGNRHLVKNGKYTYSNIDAEMLYGYINDLTIAVGANRSGFILGFVTWYRSDTQRKYDHARLLRIIKEYDDKEELAKISLPNMVTFLNRELCK